MRSRFSLRAVLPVSLLLLGTTGMSGGSGSSCSDGSQQAAAVEQATTAPEEEPTPVQSLVPPQEESVAPPAEVEPPPPDGGGETPSYSIFPFGAFNIDKQTYGVLFTSTMRSASPGQIVDTLTLAQERGARLVISLAGGSKSHYQNADETFNLNLWKDGVDRFASVDLDPFIADGTIVAHYLVDEPKAQREWGGQEIPDDVIDEMARYSRQYWPEMLTTVRAQPTPNLAESGWEWQWLDAAWAQYAARKGPVEEYAAEQVAAARALGLGLIMGMNPINGGDGSSGIPGRDSGKWAMSADEVVRDGIALMEDPYVCAFLIWRYYDDNQFRYFAIPEIASAMVRLAGFAAGRPAPACAFH